MRTNNLLKSIAGLSLAFIVSTISLYSQETIQLNGNVDLTSTSGITIISQGTNKIVSYNDSFKVQSNYAFKKVRMVNLHLMYPTLSKMLEFKLLIKLLLVV